MSLVAILNVALSLLLLIGGIAFLVWSAKTFYNAFLAQVTQQRSLPNPERRTSVFFQKIDTLIQKGSYEDVLTLFGKELRSLRSPLTIDIDALQQFHSGVVARMMGIAEALEVHFDALEPLEQLLVTREELLRSLQKTEQQHEGKEGRTRAPQWAQEEFSRKNKRLEEELSHTALLINDEFQNISRVLIKASKDRTITFH